MNALTPTVQHRPGLRLTRALPWLVLVMGLLVTVRLHHDAGAAAEQRLADEFSVRAQGVVDAIDKRLHDYEQVLRGAAGLFAAGGDISRAGFRAYVDRLEISKHYPGIQGLGFAAVIPPALRAQHVARVRAEGFPDYTVHPDGNRSVLTAIVFLEPLSGRNLRAFGYDMHSEPVRRAAMERARDSGATAVSSKVRLLQETAQDVQAGFLMYIPVYAGGALPLTVEARREALRGWAYAPFRTRDLMEGILKRAVDDPRTALRLEIYDGTAASPDALMYDSAAGTDAPPEAQLSVTRTIARGGQPWTVRIGTRPVFGARDGRQPVIAGAGIGLSVLMALIVHLLGSGHARAVRYAEKMNRDLSESEARFRLVANSAPVMIWMSDTTHRCIWTNRHGQEFTGRTAEPGTCGWWREIIHPDDFEQVSGAFHAVAGQRQPFRTECRARRSDGVYRWVINTGVPRFDPQGAFVGYIGSCLDITERKLAEKQLQDMSRRLEQYAAEIEDLYQNAPCGYHSLDARGNIVAINDTELRWLGYTREELVGKSFLSLLPPEEHAAFAQRFPPRDDRIAYRDIPHTLVRKDGSRLPASLGATLVRDAKGHFLRTRSVVHDMTEHNRLERERAEHSWHVERLSRRLVAVQEEERRRLAATLHDWTSPNLATLKLTLAGVARAAEGQTASRVGAMLEDAQALLDDTTAGLREICSDLRPTVLDFAGLHPALESYASQYRLRTGIDVRLFGAAPGPLSSEIESALFRIAQEALANCAKHAGASVIDVTLERTASDVRLTISDNGTGFDATAGLSGGLGLITMRERAEFVGGAFSIESAPGAGVTICVTIPLTASAAGAVQAPTDGGAAESAPCPYCDGG